MITTTAQRITATLAAGLIAAAVLIGILIGMGGGLSTANCHNLADYGAAVTADDATDHARSEGVPHMGDHRHSAGYFERMDGIGGTDSGAEM